MSEKKRQTWGYRRREAKVFDLREGEKLPPGWSDAPPPGMHPNVPPGREPPLEEPPSETLPPVSESETYKREVEKVNRAPETPPKTERPKK